MTKRTSGSKTNDTKPANKSPNPQEKKKRRDSSEEGQEKEKPVEMTENDGPGVHAAAMDLGSKFDAAVEVKLEGGKHIWKNLISGAKPTWTNIDDGIKAQYKPFDVSELFGEPGMPTIHNLALKGKNIRGLGTGAHLTTAGWKSLFTEVFEAKTDLAKSIKGETMRKFGMRLALTDPKLVFLIEDGVWKDNGLVDRLDTSAWTGAYTYFGAV